MAPIATVCNNNKMKKLAAEAVPEAEEPAISTVSPPAAMDASISEYITFAPSNMCGTSIFNLEFFHISFPISNVDV